MAIGKNLIAPLTEAQIQELKSNPNEAIPKLYKMKVFDEFINRYVAGKEEEKIELIRALRKEFVAAGAKYNVDLESLERTLSNLVINENENNKVPSIKIKVTGSPQSGKTSLIYRACDNRISSDFTPYVIDFMKTFHETQDDFLKLIMWDTNRDESSLRHGRNMQNIRYDIFIITVKNDEESFKMAEDLLKQAGNNYKILIVGTMSAENDPAFDQKLKALSEKYDNVPFTRVDSKAGFGFRELKNHLVKIYRESHPNPNKKQEEATGSEPPKPSRSTPLAWISSWFQKPESSNAAQNNPENRERPKPK